MWLHILVVPHSSWGTSFYWFRWKYGPPYCKSAMLFYLSMWKDMCNQILNEILHVHFQVWKVRLFDTLRLWGGSWLFPLFLRNAQCRVSFEWQWGGRWSQRQEVKSDSAFGLIGGWKLTRQTCKQCLRWCSYTIQTIIDFCIEVKCQTWHLCFILFYFYSITF